MFSGICSFVEVDREGRGTIFTRNPKESNSSCALAFVEFGKYIDVEMTLPNGVSQIIPDDLLMVFVEKKNALVHLISASSQFKSHVHNSDAWYRINEVIATP